MANCKQPLIQIQYAAVVPGLRVCAGQIALNIQANRIA